MLYNTENNLVFTVSNNGELQLIQKIPRNGMVENVTQQPDVQNSKTDSDLNNNPGIEDNCSLPFKDVLFCPSEKKEKKLGRKSKTNIKLPSVVTSETWNNYYKSKEEEKLKMEKEKLLRKEERQKKKELKIKEAEIKKTAQRIKKEKKKRYLPIKKRPAKNKI